MLRNGLLFLKNFDRSPFLEKVELSPALIETATGTDYEYRAFVKREAWEDYLMEVCSEIDYHNFKSMIEETMSDKPPVLEARLNSMYN
ncbi:MAG: hypothetical protein RQ756_02240, partial [Flavobacteriaceae bacterium]|nr:hypothetical protein [Flavobacteriaceae bacterium]